ncbi:hypothetical protein SGLAD_v1c03600 [Spiroplasma gladiatoris]|uniref:DUF2779 domain-containing protein n=1 Tax=Spiroplasma gladiatoris TaxID=2143 RepID=A0A4V1AQ79_9MOLU|nr:DUF2779 domain-containing protein [Spiroplasma gladiatoris]QBQ07559.1 hypothetical protein SGLAD_v1c03600 [Spiroplasma gladiatoris]
MILKNVVKKEDFKKWFTSCNKEAWIFHDITNFEKALELKKQKVYEYFLKTEIDDGGFDTSSGFDPLELYSELLNKEDLSEEEEKQKETLLKTLESFEGIELSPMSAETILDGEAVGQAAREYFIEKLESENIKNKTNFKYFDFQQFGYELSANKTKEILLDSDYKLFFEPTFEVFSGKLRTRCDVLWKNQDNQFEIIEVKASTKEKKEHIFDLLYQYIVVSKNYNIKEVKLCLINNDYYRGLEHPLVLLENLEDLDSKVDYEKEVKPFLENDFEVENTNEPEDINYQILFNVKNRITKNKKTISFKTLFECILYSTNIEDILLDISNSFDNENILKNDLCGTYKIDYKNFDLKLEENKYCKHVVNWFDKTDYTLFNLPRFKQKAAKYFRQFDKLNLESLTFNDLTQLEKPSLKEYFNDDLKKIIIKTNTYLKNNKVLDPTDVIDLEKLDVLEEVLREYYDFPLYMYDFETSKWAIPKYNKTKSYQQIPFQFSIHILKDEDYDFNQPNKTMDHYNFIASSIEDPRPDFIKQFIIACFSKGPGRYVAYNKSFERMVLKDLMTAFPKYLKPLKYIYENTIDLMDFFKKPKSNWLIYHPDFRGSASIKTTQPTLDSSLSYKDLKINKGDKASSVFRRYADQTFSQEQWDQLYKNDMLLYCDRDTLAMVVVLQKIIEIVKEAKPDIVERIRKVKLNEV